MKNILVTGGAGFIGTNFILGMFKASGFEKLVTLDLLTYAGNIDNLRELEGDPRYRFEQADIRDLEAVSRVVAEQEIDTIVNFAAETHVDRSILGPIQFLETNMVGTGCLLEAARKAWAGRGEDEVRFHHISTDEVFGSLAPDDPPFSERTAYAPNSPYSASKAGSDHLVRAYRHTYGLPVTISNCTDNYGPYQFPEKLIPLVILNCLTGKPIPVYGDGKQVRDWLYVEDHCDAIRVILERGRVGETYLIGGDNQPTNLEIIRSITDIFDEIRPDSPYNPHFKLVQFVKDRPGHDRRYDMDISRIERELGWSPKVSLQEGLRKTVTWYLEHLDWLDCLSQKPELKDWMEKNYSGRRVEK
ncbi:MAG TPA: dTDP-glucose 4,6-dehydratase [Anaerolineaceae bacterium]|nr:dTDP-glucose 4,6-dehydratase [Anaerolineaceae bacterium]